MILILPVVIDVLVVMTYYEFCVILVVIHILCKIKKKFKSFSSLHRVLISTN